MKMKYFTLALLVLIAVFHAGIYVGNGNAERQTESVTETAETIADTIVYNVPTPQATTALGTQSYVLPKYVFIGGGVGGEPRRCAEKDSSIVEDVARQDCVGEKTLQYDNDSAVIELPMVQRHYADSAFEAWVSGPVDPRLDSVRVSAPTTIITKREWKPPKRWHIGPTIGYGYTSNGFEPYIGVSLTYSIISW